MKRNLILLFAVLFSGLAVTAQDNGGFTIKNFDVHIRVNKDASLDIDEDIKVNFFVSGKHGIYRDIPVQYNLLKVPEGVEKADRQLESNGKSQIILENIKVDDWDTKISNKGDYKRIRIGSADSYVDGDQEYRIHYKVLNAINFYKGFSELNYNITGNEWPVPIENVHFNIELYNELPETPRFFVATGYSGSTENNTDTKWSGNKSMSGNSTKLLSSREGVTVGIRFPDGFLVKQNYMLREIKWLIMPLVALVLFYLIWWKWGKDEDVTVTTEFYPPANTSPSVAGYIIDDKLDRRDLTALIPYWGGGGYLRVVELNKNNFEFIKLKELPDDAMDFEKTLFNGIFYSGDKVNLSSLKNVLYTSMNSAKSQLEAQVDKGAYYETGSRGWGGFLFLVGLVCVVYGGYHMFKHWGNPIWFSLGLIISGILAFIFGAYMPKKTRKGNELYQKLAGFKEFIQMVEKPRLEQFLKEDEHYFDKVLPYAIVFDVADKWKDKLKDMDIPPPGWYSGGYSGNFTTYMFLNSLDNSMNRMTESFYSAPSSSGTSGGSWSGGGGGGFSGGGFGGGGGGSW